MPLPIHVKAVELFNQATGTFYYTDPQTLILEHSLVSISKWESKWHKMYLETPKKTADELIDYSPMLKGIMAQNTFEMARKAVNAVITNAKQGEMVPTFYITEDNLNDPAVKPFLDFYGKQAPAVIDGLAEKLLGKR